MKKILLILIFTSVALIGFTQEIETNHVVVNSSGNNQELSFGSLEWSIGEPVTEMIVSEHMELTQGFHQPLYFLSEITDPNVEILVKVYPNPTPDKVTVRIDSEGIYDMELIEVTGKKLMSVTGIEEKTVEFYLRKYSGHQFLLKIKKQDDILFKTFKIIRQ